MRRRSLLMAAPVLVLSACGGTKVKRVKVTGDPQEVKVTASPKPLQDKPQDDAAPVMNDDQINIAMDSLRVGLLQWAHQDSAEAPQDRMARLAQYLTPDSKASQDAATPLIVQSSDSVQDGNSPDVRVTTSAMVASSKVVNSAGYSVVGQYVLTVIPQFTDTTQGSAGATSQGQTFDYTVQVAGDWTNDAWLISSINYP